MTNRAIWNVNKLVGRLRIRAKLAVAFLLLSGVPLAAVGWYAADQHLRSLRAGATLEQSRHLDQMRTQVDGLLESVSQDLRFLERAAARAAEARGTDSMDVLGSDAVAVLLSDLLTSKPYYYRLRYLAPSGEELVHVARSDAGPVRLTPADWRRAGHSFYRKLVADAGALSFVPVELRDRTIDVAADPRLVSAFSFVTTVGTGPDPVLLVADVYASEILRRMDVETSETQQVMLVGPSGHYLYHSSTKTDWNTLLATQREQSIEEDFPAVVSDHILAEGASGGVLLDAPGWVIAFGPLFAGAPPDVGDYVLVSAVHEDVAFAPVWRVQRVVLAAGGVTLLVAAVLALLAADQFASPIRALRAGAARMAAGDFETRLEVSSNDELEDLAAAFESMASAIAAREGEIRRQSSELEQYAHDLEAMVQERTRELRESHRRMTQQEKMVAVGQLASGVAHELGTPLGAILCHAELAAEEIEADPGSAAANESLRTVIAQTERTRDIVRNLLDFSRPSSRDKAEIDLRDVVSRAVELLRHDLELRGVCLRMTMPASSASVIGNLNEVEQLVVNLVRNAADAIHAEGAVRIDLAIDESTGQACLRVVDEGSGIAADHLDHVFEPFFTTKSPGVGTGLGLWISYNIAAEHGGALVVERTGPAGTVMRLELPLADADAS